ncbi:MAG: hypothetical protein J0H15_11465 [Xanthomonadales bacterium]|nr:hypothetical protein [Xanthomonadales bacterium]
MSVALDAARLAATAATLDVPPRHLLVLAGRLALRPEQPLGAADLQRELARLIQAGAASDTAARLLGVPPFAFATDEVDRMLQVAWARPPRTP